MEVTELLLKPYIVRELYTQRLHDGCFLQATFLQNNRKSLAGGSESEMHAMVRSTYLGNNGNICGFLRGISFFPESGVTYTYLIHLISENSLSELGIRSCAKQKIEFVLFCLCYVLK